MPKNIPEEDYVLTDKMSLFLDYADNNGWAVMMKRWFSVINQEWLTSYAVRDHGIVVYAADTNEKVSEKLAEEVIANAKKIVGDF